MTAYIKRSREELSAIGITSHQIAATKDGRAMILDWLKFAGHRSHLNPSERTALHGLVFPNYETAFAVIKECVEGQKQMVQLGFGEA